MVLLETASHVGKSLLTAADGPHLGPAIILCGQHFSARLPISAVMRENSDEEKARSMNSV
jgi:hypothetical protein